MNKQPTIGIIGAGFIGAILKRYFKNAKQYDIAVDIDKLEDVLACDVIFLAFNVLDNGVSEKSKEDIERYPKQAPQGRVFVIKSTFVPGMTDYLQVKYPQHTFIYNPEFLTEMTAWKDFTEPQFQILGCPQKAIEQNNLIHWLFTILPKAPVTTVISPHDAEVFKHAKNTYYALKVTWFNQLYDACKEINADYETVRSLLVKDPWIGDSHSVIFHKGYRGFGGKCLSKDPKIFGEMTHMPLINHIEEYNGNLRS